MEMVGIYSILNRKSNKRYVGQSVHIATRIHSHFKALSNHHHQNTTLQKDYDNDYRFFTYEILETDVAIDKLSEREAYWSNYYSSFNPALGYNHQGINKKRAYVNKNRIENIKEKQKKPKGIFD